MTGNTWDWTSSQYQGYRYDATDGREDPTASDVPRVVRGRSWFVGRDFTRASFRDVSHPDDRSYSLGLRVVRSSPGLS
jgi:formylglycine-generating enzyme required for sulfatase activity